MAKKRLLTQRQARELQAFAVESIRTSLRGMAGEVVSSKLGNASATVAANQDGTIDGELRVFDLTRKISVNRILIELERIFWGETRSVEVRKRLPSGKYRTASQVKSVPSPWRLPTTRPRFWVSVGGLTDWGTKDQFQRVYDKLIKQGMDEHEAAETARASASPLPRYKGLGRVAAYPQPMAKSAINFLTARKHIFARQMRKGRNRPEQILVRIFWDPDDIKPGKR